MDMPDEIYVTSRSRTPSIIDVSSQNEHIFSQLPDLIQEAAVSAECEVSDPSRLSRELIFLGSFQPEPTCNEST